MLGGVGGGVTLPEASAGGAVNPAKNARASAAMRAPISFESPKAPFGCNVLQFMFVMFFFSFYLRLILAAPYQKSRQAECLPNCGPPFPALASNGAKRSEKPTTGLKKRAWRLRNAGLKAGIGKPRAG